MRIIPFPKRPIQHGVQFRCYACRVAFTPTAQAITHCEQCTAGMALHSALLAYQRVDNQRTRS
jgi:hypothetical protein